MTKEICNQATQTAFDKGFHEYLPVFGQAGRDARHLLSLLMLVTTEVSEAAEEVRKGTSLSKLAEELADVCIRVFDMAGLLNIDLEKAITQKMEANRSRTIRHGGKLA